MNKEDEESVEYKLLFEKSPDPIVLVGSDAKIKMANAAFLSLVGEKAEAVIGKSFLDYVAPEDRKQLSEYHEKRRLNPELAPSRYEFTLLTKQGEKKVIDRTVILLPDGKTTLSVLRDITAYKQLEAQLIQAQKMEAIGRLVGTIAHDFNNILQGIIGYCQLLLGKMNERDPRWKYIYQINQLSGRAANLIQRLLLFSRKHVVETTPINLNQIVNDMKEMIVRIIGEDIQCEFLLEKELWEVEADVSQIEQVLMNLITNAREAMPEGGKLIIETKNTRLDKKFASIRGIRPGDYVVLSVTDTGIGMDEQIKQHCFEPFFTTKKDGTGLGLSIVYGIVNQMKGCIRIYSESNKGTTIKIYLPKTKSNVFFQEEAEPSNITLGGGKTILVAEDDEAIREVLKDMLQELGYKALFAKNGEEAIKLAEAYSGSLHLLLTDVVMPDINGYELAKRLSTLHPNIKVVYMSGYPKIDYPETDAKIFIQKPFSINQLAVKLEEALKET
ncbi:MAG TPA: response regulator [Candidatus Desulfofervidus auxilii]|uniref:histidine kinase n=1 Tax=Desulfofervidus auxilii TaxID=1621989 RepID=A0A7C0Y463_DESA2|nr:response regulator [Candidatus Desulfofervidus auxilii]